MHQSACVLEREKATRRREDGQRSAIVTPIIVCTFPVLVPIVSFSSRFAFALSSIGLTAARDCTDQTQRMENRGQPIHTTRRDTRAHGHQRRTTGTQTVQTNTNNGTRGEGGWVGRGERREERHGRCDNGSIGRTYAQPWRVSFLSPALLRLSSSPAPSSLLRPSSFDPSVPFRPLPPSSSF